jgi:hypothetical protein
MSPTQIDMALSVIRILGNSIQARMQQQSELVDLFRKATEENRDFTKEEMKVWKVKAEAAISDLGDLIPEL